MNLFDGYMLSISQIFVYFFLSIVIIKHFTLRFYVTTAKKKRNVYIDFHIKLGKIDMKRQTEAKRRKTREHIE